VGQLTELTKGSNAQIPVLLQAGGQGTRLRPYTDQVPKPMLQVGGVPILERLLRHFVALGFREFVIVVGRMGETIDSHFHRIDVGDVDLTLIREEAPRGNVGALQNLEGRDTPVVLAFGDLLTDLDANGLVEEHVQKENDLTLASHLYRDHMEFGELVIDGGRVLEYREKPERQYLICSGIFVASPRAVRQIRMLGPKAGLVDLVRSCISTGFKVGSWRHNASWLDINSGEMLHRANDLLVSSARNSCAKLLD
jgi:NDP-sugar pyrophosphorylase family protein